MEALSGQGREAQPQLANTDALGTTQVLGQSTLEKRAKLLNVCDLALRSGRIVATAAFGPRSLRPGQLWV